MSSIAYRGIRVIGAAIVPRHESPESICDDASSRACSMPSRLIVNGNNRLAGYES